LLESDSPDDESNEDDSRLEWKTAAACLSSGVNVTALANAAAEFSSNWGSFDCSIRSFFLVHQTGSGVSTESGSSVSASIFLGCWVSFVISGRIIFLRFL